MTARGGTRPTPAPSGEVALDSARLWVEFPDPADVADPPTSVVDPEDQPDTVYRVDLTWLTSNYTCLFGAGCPGIYADAPDVGCCTLGAHFTEPADEKRVARVVRRLTPEVWQFHPQARPARGGWTEVEDGARKTRVHEGGCILANRPGFPAGAGCALHLQALRDGVDPLTYKPDVCWQLPLKRAYRTVTRGDGSTYLEVTITEYGRRDWGAGGHDLDWYCTSNPAAHVADRPVFRSMENELREMIGDAPYEELARHCEALVARSGRSSAHRRLLPLTVHPADR